MVEQPSALTRAVRWLTGARKGESQRVVLCFLALHFLLISYYLIKPLRNSQFLKEFDPSFLPVVSFGVVIVSFAFTKLFSYLADRVEKYRLVTGAYLAIISLKLAFGWLLTVAGKPAVVAFYFFASVYFLLAIATMWACANDIFSPDQGERCYGFIAVGSTLGGIVGSKLSSWLSESTRWSDYAPLASALCMAIALGLILLAARRRREERAIHSAGTAQDQVPAEFWTDLGEILRRPYVRRIGTMVFVLAMFNTSLDYISNRAIDQGVTLEQFGAVFQYLPAEAYTAVYDLKQKPKGQRQTEYATLATLGGTSPEQIAADYERYRQRCETATRSVFSDVYFYQGLLGIVLLLIVARLVFKFLGVRFAVMILPAVAALGVIAFAFPLALVAVETIMVVVGSSNYSLNNAAKELLYTASDEETKFKYKPLIEGPGLRLGDVTAAVITLVILHSSQWLGWSEDAGQTVLQIVLLSAIAAWMRAVYLAGREYDLERRNATPASSAGQPRSEDPEAARSS